MLTVNHSHSSVVVNLSGTPFIVACNKLLDPGFGAQDCVDPDLGGDGIAIKSLGSDFGCVTTGASGEWTFTLSLPESEKVCRIYREGLTRSR